MSATLSETEQPQRHVRSERLVNRRNTKIVCTLGPACQTTEQISQLLRAGANVFRLNFSHGDHDSHTQTLQAVRTAADQLGLSPAVMQDLCGPKIRISRLAHDDFLASDGQLLRLTTEMRLSGKEHNKANGLDQPLEFDLATNYAALIDDVHIGQVVLIDDGRIELAIEEIHPDYVAARVRCGGPILLGKGLNLPGLALDAQAMTPKDWNDLEWGVEHQVDYIALSFVRHPDDLIAVREKLDDLGSRAQLIAKIERPEAIDCIAQIVEVADGLMVARGDLGLETDLARVPLLQKQLIELCRSHGKPVITATQMLESMIDSPRPTRAEASDVANAICDGTDAIMLSGETATGRYPRQAVEVLHRVAQVTESGRSEKMLSIPDLHNDGDPLNAILQGAAITATSLDARRLVIYTQSGLTARLMSRYRLSIPIVAVTNDPAAYRQLSLVYGIEPVYQADIFELPQLLTAIDSLAQEYQWGEAGDLVVVVSALDGCEGNTDTLHLHRLGR